MYLICLLIITNFFNTGCLIYPVQLLCFESFSWSIPLNEVELMNNWYQQWSKAGATPHFRVENPETKANYWLMAIELSNKSDRDLFLKETNSSGITTRPIWQLMFRLPMFQNCFRDSQRNSIYLEERIVNIPSSVRK